MSPSAERRAAAATVCAFHEAQLAQLVERVGLEIDRFRAGELNAFEADQALFQYSRAAKELWKFCNGVDVEWVAQDIRERAPSQWWERGTGADGDRSSPPIVPSCRLRALLRDDGGAFVGRPTPFTLQR